VNTTTNENHATSHITTVDEESGSDEELISGSAQSHSVFNLVELATVMDKGYAFLAPSFPLPFGFNVDYIGSQIPQI
jgi:hypothetical protein